MHLKELEKPTKQWEERMKEGDDLFTEESIKDSEQALDLFEHELNALGKHPKHEDILSVVKRLVEKFNAINNRHHHIDTIEREELCEYIFQAIKSVGISDAYDMTEEWREW